MPGSTERPREYSGRVAVVFALADKLSAWKRRHSTRIESSETPSPDGRLVAKTQVVMKESGEVTNCLYEIFALDEQTGRSICLLSIGKEQPDATQPPYYKLIITAFQSDESGWLQHVTYYGNTDTSKKSQVESGSWPLLQDQSETAMPEFFERMRTAGVPLTSELPTAPIDLEATFEALRAQIESGNFSQPQLINAHED